MTPLTFAAWRRHMGLSQKAAAEALGVSLRMVCYYEAGNRTDGAPRPVAVPRSIELACAALALGITSYNGPQ
jgi:transcriptional regulator with XRE-family HTH domain